MTSALGPGNGTEHAYVLFDPLPWRFPPPVLPVLPVLRRDALRSCSERPLWAAREHRLYTKARYALRDALALCGVGPQGAFLAPAYHCRTMIDPAIALGAPLVFFKLTPRLAPDLEDVAHQLRQSRVPIRALLMPHYFGLMQQLQPLAALCKQHGVQLIEDCAHSLPLSGAPNGIGGVGDWCIASPYKFFPCADGGVLWSGTGHPWPPGLSPLRRPSLRSELGKLMHLRALSRRRAPARTPVDASPAPASAEERGSLAVHAQLDGPSSDYRSSDEGLACAASSRWLIAHTDINNLLVSRRKNYLAWAAAAHSFTNARALAPELDRSDTPYMFPLLVDAPVEQFARVKRAGVPVYRWDSLAASGCDVSARLRLHLLHLPCHQALQPGDLEWMINTVGACLEGGPVELHA